MRRVSVLLVILLSPALAWSAIVLDLITTAGVSGDFGDLSFSHTVAADANFLLVCTSTTQAQSPAPGEEITSVTYAGQALTPLIQRQHGTQIRTELWYRLAPATGTNTVAVNTANDPWGIFTALSFKGVDQVAPTHVASTDAESGTPTLTLTSAVGEYVVDCLTNEDGGSSGVASAPQVERRDQGHDNIRHFLSTMDGAAPTVQPDWVLDGTYTHAYVAVSLVPASVTPAVGKRRLVLFP